MKDLLRRKPSLSCLTGISESRLDSFATHLHAYLLGCLSSVEVSPAAFGPSETECQSSCSVSGLLHPYTMSEHAGKVHSFCQGSLSPRLNCFKDEMPRIASSIRTREKVKRHGDAHLSTLIRSSELIASVSTSSTNVVSGLRVLSLPTLVTILSIPSSVSVSSSLSCSQLPIFTPFVSDPIVHIPVINFCYSGQAYLVNAGLAISSVISPLLPSLVTPLISKMLHMLMASAPSVYGPQLMNALPSVLNNLDKKFSSAYKVNNHSAITSSSQLFRNGSSDRDTVSTDLPCLNFYSGGAPHLGSWRKLMDTEIDGSGASMERHRASSATSVG